MSDKGSSASDFLERAYAGAATPRFLPLPAEGLATIYPDVISNFEETVSVVDKGNWIDLGIGQRLAPPVEVTAGLSMWQDFEPSHRLKSALVDKYREEQRLTLIPDWQILLTGGARVGFAVAMLGLINPGDVVVIPDPDYIGLTHMASAIGARVIRMPYKRQPNGSFALDRERLAHEISGAALFAFTNPNNPMGMIWSRDDLVELAQLADRHDVMVLTSEIYDELVFDERGFTSLTGIGNPERTVIINGTAKAYNMQGFALGWMICGARLAAQLGDLMVLTHQAVPSELSMRAATIALSADMRRTFPAQLVDQMLRTAYQLTALLAQYEGVLAPMPAAGQFLFPQIGGDDFSFAQQLKAEEGLLTVPGSIWGSQGQGHLRLSLVPSAELLEEGILRLSRALSRRSFYR